MLLCRALQQHQGACFICWLHIIHCMLHEPQALHKQHPVQCAYLEVILCCVMVTCAIPDRTLRLSVSMQIQLYSTCRQTTHTWVESHLEGVSYPISDIDKHTGVWLQGCHQQHRRLPGHVKLLHFPVPRPAGQQSDRRLCGGSLRDNSRCELMLVAVQHTAQCVAERFVNRSCRTCLNASK
jgi:hypothetical protein